MLLLRSVAVNAKNSISAQSRWSANSSTGKSIRYISKTVFSHPHWHNQKADVEIFLKKYDLDEYLKKANTAGLEVVLRTNPTATVMVNAGLVHYFCW